MGPKETYMKTRNLIRALEVGTGCLVLVAMLFVVAAKAQRKTPNGESSAARTQKLMDIEEIRTLLTGYGRLLDAHDLAGYSRLFAEDGEWIGGFGSAKGPAAIQALMEKNLGVAPRSKPGSTFHLLTNFEIDVKGETATAWSRWTFVVTGADNKPSPMYAGHYDDTLVREKGRWRFKKRVVTNDIPQ